MEMVNKRAFINYLCGLAIFLMLWGHSIQYCCGGQFDFFENTVFKIIYAFHMPFFMMISGYLFFFSAQKRGMTELVIHRSQALLYPILMCSALNLLLTDGIVSVLRMSNNYLVGGISLNSLWFLWSVLSASIVLAVATKSSKNSFIRGLLLIVGICVVAIFPCWDLDIYMYPYFVVGYLFAKNEDRVQSAFNIIGLLSTLGFVIMLFFFEKKHYIYTSGLMGGETLSESLTIDLFRWAIGLFGGVGVVWISKTIFCAIKNKGSVIIGIESLGRDSLAVYALSVSLLSFWLPKIANEILDLLPWIDWNRSIFLYDLVVTPVVAVAYAGILLLIIKLLKRCNVYKIIFGR